MQRRTFLTTGAIGTAATALASPAIAQDKRQWKMVTAWPKNLPGPGVAAQLLADRITTLSGGRIEVKLFPAGELVPGRGVFDAVSEGTAELYHAVPAYWGSKSKGILLFGSQPFGLRADEQVGWMMHGGGQELYDEMYGRFGIKPFLCGNSGPQWGGWFREEIESVEDLQGLKMRTPGFAGEVMSEVGVAVTNIPPGELYSALERGTIDALEWVGPALDFQMGFHQIAKYYYSGWQEPGAEVQFLINQKTWDELPEELQEILRVSMRTAAYDMYIQSTHESGVAWDRMKEDYPNVTHKTFPPEVIEALREATEKLLAEESEKDELAREIITSQQEYLKQVRQWTNISDKAYLNSVSGE